MAYSLSLSPAHLPLAAVLHLGVQHPTRSGPCFLLSHNHLASSHFFFFPSPSPPSLTSNTPTLLPTLLHMASGSGFFLSPLTLPCDFALSAPFCCRCKVSYPNGDTFEGSFNEKLEKHGRGVYTWGTAVGNNPWVPEEGFPGECTRVFIVIWRLPHSFVFSSTGMPNDCVPPPQG